jgi:hypothetical protein
MARGGGGRKGNDNLIALAAGGVAAAIVDFAASQYNVQGLQNRFGTILNGSDVVQMAGSAGTALYGFARGGERVAAFGFGGFLTQIVMKVVFEAMGWPRYIIFGKGGVPSLPVARYAGRY